MDGIAILEEIVEVQEIAGNAEKEFEEQWEEELVSRIHGLEEYQRQIRPMTKRDYIIAAVIVGICLCALVAGAYISG